MDVDVIVVGGGLAGSALATSLARQGRQVLVIEREIKFKDRVRGLRSTPGLSRPSAPTTRRRARVFPRLHQDPMGFPDAPGQGPFGPCDEQAPVSSWAKPESRVTSQRMDAANAMRTARSPAGYTGSIRFPELCGQPGLQPSPKHVLRSAGEGF
jgi:choline dehydrogenase-like flavoprotein